MSILIRLLIVIRKVHYLYMFTFYPSPNYSADTSTIMIDG